MSRETRVAQLDTAVDNLVAAIAAKNWTTAENELLQAEAILLTVPDTNREASGMRWQREQIAEFRKLIMRKKNNTIKVLDIRHDCPTLDTVY